MPKASHTNHHVLLETRTGVEVNVVVRRFTDAGRLATDPWYVPSAEVDALRTIASLDLPAPHLLDADLEPSACDVPTLLLTWLPGSAPERPADLEGFARTMAEPLPLVHSARPGEGARRFAPYDPIDELSVPAWSPDTRMWEHVLDVVRGTQPPAADVFIHRDYHHANTLWHGGKLSGIVDWTTGCVGPPGIDLGWMRMNLAWDFGSEAARSFLAAAVNAGVGAYHPYWDLLCAAEWLDDRPPTDEEERRGFDRFEAYVRGVLASCPEGSISCYGVARRYFVPRRSPTRSRRPSPTSVSSSRSAPALSSPVSFLT